MAAPDKPDKPGKQMAGRAGNTSCRQAGGKQAGNKPTRWQALGGYAGRKLPRPRPDQSRLTQSKGVDVCRCLRQLPRQHLGWLPDGVDGVHRRRQAQLQLLLDMLKSATLTRQCSSTSCRSATGMYMSAYTTQ